MFVTQELYHKNGNLSYSSQLIMIICIAAIRKLKWFLPANIRRRNYITKHKFFTYDLWFLSLLRFHILSFVFVPRLDAFMSERESYYVDRFYPRGKINFFFQQTFFVLISSSCCLFRNLSHKQKKSSLITQSDRATFHECTPGVMSPIGRLEIDRPMISPLAACYTYLCVREHHESSIEWILSSMVD